MDIALSVLLMCVTVQAANTKVDCPPPNEACDCGDWTNTDVFCRGITSFPSHLPSNVTFLDLDSNNMGSALLKIHMERLENLTLTNLYLSGTGLRAIDYRAFMPQTSLRMIDLSNNEFKRLEGPIFFGLSQLEVLVLKKSSIYEISSTVFTYTPSLRYLDLGGNQMAKITHEFVTLSNLKSLSLSHNQISSVSADSLANLIRLSHLDIAGNHLTVPQAKLFKHIVANNGTLKLQAYKSSKNQWECWGQKALDYYDFLQNLTKQFVKKDQYDIQCSSPQAFAGQMLGDLDRDKLTKTDPIVSSTTGIKAFTTPDLANTNSLSRLSNGQIAVIFIVIIVAVIVITAFVVRHCVIIRRRRAFGEFVDNLPNAMEVDDDDTLTTKTYRQDAPVYGSTGKVFDRHINTKSNDYTASAGKGASSDRSNIETPEGKPTKKRRPPPYDPPSPSSPEGFQNAYIETQFNNSSSVCMDDYHGYNKMLGRIASYPIEYDSDDGNVLWNIRNIK